MKSNEMPVKGFFGCLGDVVGRCFLVLRDSDLEIRKRKVVLLYISEINIIPVSGRITTCRYFRVFIMEIKAEASAASDSFQIN